MEVQRIWNANEPLACVPLLVQLAETVPPALLLSMCQVPCSVIVPLLSAVVAWSGYDVAPRPLP